MDNGNHLTEKDIKVLMALEEKPLATFDELASMTGFPKSSVFNIYESLNEEKKEELPFFSVLALPNIKNLGLEIVDVIVESPKSSQYKFLKEFCLEHPYTAYDGRSYGSTNGMLIQFRIPQGTSSFIEEVFHHFSSCGIIESFQLFSFPDNYIYTTTQVKYWNHSALSWDFSWKSWFNLENSLWDQGTFEQEKIASQPKLNQGVVEPSALKWLKQSDIHILIELMKNSRRKRVEFMQKLEENKNLKFTRQTFSRRLKKLSEECVQGHRLFFKSHAFDLHNPTLLIGYASERFIENLYIHLQKHPIPFTSTFKHNKKSFFWYIHMPSTHLSDLLFELNPYLENLQLNVIDHPRSLIYYFYAKAFDEKTKQWNKSHDFMVDDVLTYMDDWKKKNK
ncbi:hypothetical protein NEF87_000025 [Candidatus Lokiarchaeum ossiferum]|uniref:Lrp/AsnC family transcriptional regulator n=1 Tax=Candidatus Lokiarchaeum ossiferum TaxID=2951803 RepID=A0ABY6HJP0_9ARCH|nr:hypothetical protein NEF87_000025 [Candidatus Lokiarchaeum sp. B-35]